MKQLIEDARAGFYGDGAYAGVSAQACQDLIRKSHQFANRIIESDDLLDGTIDNLQTHLPQAQHVDDSCCESESDFSEFDSESDLDSEL